MDAFEENNLRKEKESLLKIQKSYNAFMAMFIIGLVSFILTFILGFMIAVIANGIIISLIVTLSVVSLIISLIGYFKGKGITDKLIMPTIIKMVRHTYPDIELLDNNSLKDDFVQTKVVSNFDHLKGISFRSDGQVYFSGTISRS